MFFSPLDAAIGIPGLLVKGKDFWMALRTMMSFVCYNIYLFIFLTYLQIFHVC